MIFEEFFDFVDFLIYIPLNVLRNGIVSVVSSIFGDDN